MTRQSTGDVAGEVYKRKQRNRAANHAVDDRPPIERLYSAWSDLKAQGWQDAMYAPKDGSEIEVIEIGSTGIFRACWHSFGHKPLDSYGCFFAYDGGQEYPSHPILWRPIKSAPTPREKESSQASAGEKT